MSEAELLTLINDTLTRQDRVFEFWLSASFAVVISFFFIGDRAKKPAKLVIAFLYIASTSMLLLRWVGLGMIYVGASRELYDLGSIHNVSRATGLASASLHFIIFVSATVAVMCFIFFGKKLMGSSASST